ncbi:MAG: clan AA aspartic protease [Planctomycetia bacterium]|nr:clan AA aspartic protease [Planctomycetia bacterium]
MIHGLVNARYEAVVPLRVRGLVGVELTVDAVIDTGSTASLTLPSATIAALRLTFRATNQVMLADGSLRFVNTYDAEVDWDGAWRAVLVTEVESAPLIGTTMLTRHQVFIEFVPGGVVDITRLP